MKHEQSEALFKNAQQVIPGGVDSPVRAFKSVGKSPVFAKAGKGAKLTDEDGNVYTDYICSWGPLVLGHASDVYFEGVDAVMRAGTTYGLPTSLETELAELVCQAVPSVEKVRFVNSGTEAVMSAIRLARGYTGRDKIIKFEGCYHGHADAMLVKSGSGTLTYGEPTSAGVPEGAARDTLTATYNDAASVQKLFDENPGEIAAVIVEPVAGNMGVVPPAPGFLKELREITEKNDALLIFDEVITGFRTAFSGMQGLTGVTPDITTLGKIIGGGMPVGAFGSSDRIMSVLAPDGPVYQAGTLSGNPVAMKMGINTISYLRDHPGVYDHLNELGARLEDGLKQAVEAAGIPASVTRFGGMTTLFFTPETPYDFNSVMKSDTGLYARYFSKMLDRGYLLPPSQYEGIFVSDAHTDADIDALVADAKEVFTELMQETPAR
ncbi:MAG: glutamate-1-semialdehyde 2,1-aminomutase [Eubacteriaceae bacterium]|jgi:glutamate-1-semialdehyde 2,1-aminomutase